MKISNPSLAFRGSADFLDWQVVPRVSHYSWGFNISIKYLSPDVVSSGFQSLHAFLSFPSRFISRTKRFRPFGYARLSVGLLQSSAMDCIVCCESLQQLIERKDLIVRKKCFSRADVLEPTLLRIRDRAGSLQRECKVTYSMSLPSVHSLQKKETKKGMLMFISMPWPSSTAY